MSSEQQTRRTIRSFVIRGGRMTEAQQRAYDNLWPEYGLELEQDLDAPALFGRDAPLVLEIGYGMGLSLVEMAQAESDKNFVGIEVHPPGVGKLMMEAHRAALQNLRTYCADAVAVLDQCVAAQSLSRIQIYFPDPWHKKKHHKRRLIQPAFIATLADKLESGGILHMATDWQPYAEHMHEVMQQSDVFNNTSQDNSFVERPAWRPVTKFEKRGARLGHGVWDLVYQKH